VLLVATLARPESPPPTARIATGNVTTRATPPGAGSYLFAPPEAPPPLLPFPPPQRSRRALQGVIHRSNPARDEARASIEAVERAAAVAVCQASKGYDCWQFATAPAGGQITHLKVLGERQSGARFVRTLVGLNLDVELVSLDAQTRDLHDAEVVGERSGEGWCRGRTWQVVVCGHAAYPLRVFSGSNTRARLSHHPLFTATTTRTRAFAHTQKNNTQKQTNKKQKKTPGRRSVRG
jgi:hypothetical protein